MDPLLLEFRDGNEPISNNKPVKDKDGKLMSIRHEGHYYYLDNKENVILPSNQSVYIQFNRRDEIVISG